MYPGETTQYEKKQRRDFKIGAFEQLAFANGMTAPGRELLLWSITLCERCYISEP